MWFEIIPSFAIIAGILSVPSFAMYYVHKGVNGNPFKRAILTKEQAYHYLRDTRLTGDPYTCNGLGAIPDK